MAIKQPYSNVNAVFDKFTELYGEIADNQKTRYEATFGAFKARFGYDCAYIASSSGRVEVCGNHTDHNGGCVLSSAVSLDTLAMFMPNNQNIVRIASDKYEDVIIDLSDLSKTVSEDSNSLVKGVAAGLKMRGYKVGGFDAFTTSKVLGGAGISSSAAFEVLVAEIFNFLYNDGSVDTEVKAFVSQYAENEYYGKPCGLLDQTAIAFGGLKMLDFSDKSKIKVTNVDNKIKDFTFVLINTGGSHANLSGEYGAIPAEMKAVAKSFGKQTLMEISEEDFFNGLASRYAELDDRAVLRAVHFYEENNRVKNAVSALENGDFEEFIKNINQSGESSICKLQNCYVAGGKEQAIPKAWVIAKKFNANGATRVHGGGFAGCVLNVVKNEDLQAFIKNMSAFYGEENIIPLRVRSCGTIVL